MRHYTPLRIMRNASGEKTPAGTLTGFVWEDDQPFDPNHCCGDPSIPEKDRCRPPIESQGGIDA